MNWHTWAGQLHRHSFEQLAGMLRTLSRSSTLFKHSRKSHSGILSVCSALVAQDPQLRLVMVALGNGEVEAVSDPTEIDSSSGALHITAPRRKPPSITSFSIHCLQKVKAAALHRKFSIHWFQKMIHYGMSRSSCRDFENMRTVMSFLSRPVSCPQS